MNKEETRTRIGHRVKALLDALYGFDLAEGRVSE